MWLLEWCPRDWTKKILAHVRVHSEVHAKISIINWLTKYWCLFSRQNKCLHNRRVLDGTDMMSTFLRNVYRNGKQPTVCVPCKNWYCSVHINVCTQVQVPVSQTNAILLRQAWQIYNSLRGLYLVNDLPTMTEVFKEMKGCSGLSSLKTYGDVWALHCFDIF